jgi:hypothetical protein
MICAARSSHSLARDIIKIISFVTGPLFLFRIRRPSFRSCSNFSGRKKFLQMIACTFRACHIELAAATDQVGSDRRLRLDFTRFDCVDNCNFDKIRTSDFALIAAGKFGTGGSLNSAFQLPRRLPVGTKIESCGEFVRRFVELPNGARIPLRNRKTRKVTSSKRRLDKATLLGPRWPRYPTQPFHRHQ